MKLKIYKENYSDATVISNRFIDEYMKDKDSIELRVLFSNIEHHYSNINSGIGAIKKLIKNKVIKNYEIKKIESKIFICKK